MWQLRSVDADAKEVDVPFVQLENFPSRERILIAARELIGERLTAALERETGTEDPLPGIDTVETWGAQAAELVGPDLWFGHLGTTADGVELRGLGWWGGSPEQISQAFQTPGALITDVSGLREIVISVISGENETIFRRSEYWPLKGKALEWRAYLGEGKAEPDGKKQSLTIRLLSSPCVLVGRCLDWMSKPDERSHDGFKYGRLRHFENKHPDAAKHPGRTDHGLLHLVVGTKLQRLQQSRDRTSVVMAVGDGNAFPMSGTEATLYFVTVGVLYLWGYWSTGCCPKGRYFRRIAAVA